MCCDCCWFGSNMHVAFAVAGQITLSVHYCLHPVFRSTHVCNIDPRRAHTFIHCALEARL